MKKSVSFILKIWYCGQQPNIGWLYRGTCIIKRAKIGNNYVILYQIMLDEDDFKVDTSGSNWPAVDYITELSLPIGNNYVILYQIASDNKTSMETVHGKVTLLSVWYNTTKYIAIGKNMDKTGRQISYIIIWSWNKHDLYNCPQTIHSADKLWSNFVNFEMDSVKVRQLLLVNHTLFINITLFWK